MEREYKVGDTVKIVKSGSGCSHDDIGKIVVITSIGKTKYCGNTGYEVEPKVGNCKSGNFDGLIGYNSFELVSKTIPEMKKEYKVGDNVQIKSRKELKEIYNHFNDDHELFKFAGKDAVITKCLPFGYEIDIDEIDIDNSKIVWHSKDFSREYDWGKLSKPKPEDLTRYMVYGTTCDNKSILYHTNPEMKIGMKKAIKDDQWTGRIIGYKLVPLYEAETNIVIKTLTKTKRKVVRPKKRK